MRGWRPWRALREHDDVEFRLADFPSGPVRALYVERGAQRLILIDRSLDPVDRLAALAHELVHLERGGVADCLDVGREERTVDRIVAERLCPAEGLAALVDVLVEVEGGVTAAMVAEEFQVPVAVAERGMRALVVRRAEHRRQAG